jgi:hypothetical protein
MQDKKEILLLVGLQCFQKILVAWEKKKKSTTSDLAIAEPLCPSWYQNISVKT